MSHVCEFCQAALTPTEPANIALLRHLANEVACEEQFQFMIENLHATWTVSVSGP